MAHREYTYSKDSIIRPCLIGLIIETLESGVQQGSKIRGGQVVLGGDNVSPPGRDRVKGPSINDGGPFSLPLLAQITK